MTITDVIANFGDVIELDYANWNVESAFNILNVHPGWTQYNPRKPLIKRQGLSITSIDGGFSGVPDLDSLREYNVENGTNYHETDFNKLTSIVRSIPEAASIVNTFPGGTVGRCHFLKLDSGGFFPPHRDNGRQVPSPTFRILVPLVDFNSQQFVWLQEDKPLHLRAGRTYFINTTKIHSVFSFADNCVMMVANVLATEKAISYLLSRCKIV